MSDKLSRYFSGVAYKRLSLVEISPESSNQHELNGTKQLQKLLGSSPRDFYGRFIYLSDSDDLTVESDGKLTWYDARKAHPTRTEWRLYYKDTPVMDSASVDDLLLIAKTPDSELLVIVAEAGSTGENQIRFLFNLANIDLQNTFEGFELEGQKDTEVGFAAKAILSTLEIETVLDAGYWHAELLRKFGAGFPTTAEFSKFARYTCDHVHADTDPDSAIMEWYSREELLFRALEEHLIGQRIQDGFSNVDEFISSSLSVLNRRKSRAGHAAENQLEQVFLNQKVAYSRGKVTEGRSRPDFLFPGIAQYLDPIVPENRLTMLGVKTSCKDRWRQVLPEADRISAKHLFTLQPGVSKNQTNEMYRQNLTLVVPSQLHETFTNTQRKRILSLKEFVDEVKHRQVF